jgi:hypothetical protein
MSFFDDAISTIGRGLAQTAAGALSDATGVDVGGVMNTLFGNNQTTGGQEIATIISDLPTDWTGDAAGLTVLQDSMTAQGAQLLDLGNQITSVATAVASLSNQLAGFQTLLQTIAQQGLYQSWQTIDQQMTVYISAVDTSYQAYAGYTDRYDATPASEVAQLMVDVLNMNNGPAVALNAISAFIKDDNQGEGILQLWSNMVSPLVAGGQLDYRAAVKQYLAYYRKLAVAQLRATNLVMEAHTFNRDGASAAAAWQSYKSTILSQETTFIQWLYPLIYSGVSGKMVSWTTVHALMQLDPGVQSLGSGLPGDSYIEPSAVLRSAEELLANLYLTDPEDRRIVVHLAYQADAPVGPAVDPAVLTLAASDGSIVSPQKNDRLGAPYPWPNQWNGGWTVPIADLNFFFNTLYVRRFVFFASATAQGLADGDYNLTNLNGQNGLVPMETYLSSQGGPPPFMNDDVHLYGLHIDGVRQFDFMNFLAYVVPVPAPGYP